MRGGEMNTFDETRYARLVYDVMDTLIYQGSSKQDAITKGYDAAFFLMQKAYPDAHPHYILTSTLQVFNLAMQMLKNNNASGSEE
jgi:hypothetical protein